MGKKKRSRMNKMGNSNIGNEVAEEGAKIENKAEKSGLRRIIKNPFARAVSALGLVAVATYSFVTGGCATAPTHHNQPRENETASEGDVASTGTFWVHPDGRINYSTFGVSHLELYNGKIKLQDLSPKGEIKVNFDKYPHLKVQGRDTDGKPLNPVKIEKPKGDSSFEVKDMGY